MIDASKIDFNTNGHRVAKLLFISCSLTIALSIGMSGSYFPIKALLWHVMHGRTLSVGQSTIELPLLWWSEDRSSDRHLFVKHAAFATTMISSMDISPLSGKHVVESEADAIKWQNAVIESLHGDSRRSIYGKTIDAKGLRAYCVRDDAVMSSIYLFCRVPSIPWTSLFVGSATEIEEAESIVASFKRSN